MSADRRRSIANDATTETELNCDYIGAATSAAAATKDRPRQNSLYSDVLCATLCLRVCVCVRECIRCTGRTRESTCESEYRLQTNGNLLQEVTDETVVTRTQEFI